MRRAAGLLAALAALLVAAPAAGAALPTREADTLTVGLYMPSPSFQTGAVIGHQVVFAEGFSIDLARALAAGMGLGKIVFYNNNTFADVISAGPKPWDVTFAQATILASRERNVDFSRPYLTADQGVLLRRDLTPRPRTIADLRKLRLCGGVGTTGTMTIETRIKPTREPLLFATQRRFFRALAQGRCDALVHDAPIEAAWKAASPSSYGPLLGRIRTNEHYGAVMANDSPLKPAVNAALGRLIADGTVKRLARKWLAHGVARLPVLRQR